MTKAERRKARKAARAAGQGLTGELAVDRGLEPVEFSETTAGYRGRERWARTYDTLNGAPENDADR